MGAPLGSLWTCESTTERASLQPTFFQSAIGRASLQPGGPLNRDVQDPARTGISIIFLARPGSTRTGFGFFWPGPVRPGPVRAPCDYCTVLYSTVQYFLLVMIKKKIKNAPRSAGWAKRVFDFFSRIFTRCIKKSKKQNSKKLEFQTIFEKVTLEPL